MTRALLILNNSDARKKAMHWIANAPDGCRVEFKRPQRSKEQNDLMWARLTEVAEQLTWHGMKYTPDDWKDWFMHALRKARYMPAEEGGMVPIGMRTSDLSKEEMTELLDFIDAFAARNGVQFKERETA